MTSAQALGTTLDAATLLRVVWLVNGLILVSLFWWNRKYSLPASRAWWSPRPLKPVIGRNTYRAILLVIIMVAIVLRGLSLNSDLWIDEVLMLVRYVRQDLGSILTDFTDDNQHILYSALAHASISIFGESPAAFRLPAAVFGVGSIWAGARLARYVFGQKEALLTALLLTISYHHVWFSQSARAYTLVLFATLISTELLLRGLATNEKRYWLAYAAAIAIAAWAHLTAVLIALGHAIVLLIMGLSYLRNSRPKSWQWQPFLALALGGWITVNFYAPVIPQLIQYFNQPGAGSTPGPVAWSKPIWLVNEILHNLGIGLTLGWFSVAIAGAIGLYGLVCVIKRDWLFPLLALTPILVSGIILYLLGRSLWPRMFFPEIGYLAAIAAVGSLQAGKALARIFRRRLGLVQAAPAVVLCMLLAISLPKVYLYPKQNFTGARDYVKAQLNPGDTVLGLHMAGRVYHLYYEPGWPEIDDLEQLDDQQADSGYTWVLYTLPSYIREAKPSVQQRLDTDYEIVKKFPGTLGDGVIIVLRSKKRETADE